MAAQFPVGIHCSSSPLSTSSGSDVSEGLTLKHQQLLGIQQAYYSVGFIGLGSIVLIFGIWSQAV